MNRIYKRRTLLFFSLLALFSMLCALSCQSSASPKGGKAESDTLQAQGSVSDSLFKIRFTPKWHHQAQHAGFYMAREKGYYQKYGLDVQIISGETSVSSYEFLKRGKTDIVSMFLIAAMNKAAKDQSIVNLAQLSQHSCLMLVGKKSRGINSISSLKGKRFSLWNTDSNELGLSFANKNKLDPQIVYIDRTNTLFMHDVVDVTNVMYYNEYHSLLMSGITEDELYQIRFRDIGYDIPEDGIYTSRAYYQKYPRQCEAFAKASLEGWIYAYEHPEETLQVVIRIMKEHHLPTNISQQRWMLEKITEAFYATPKDFGKLEKGDFEAAKAIITDFNPAVNHLIFEEFYPRGKIQH